MSRTSSPLAAARRAARPRDTLQVLGIAPSATRILRYFALRPAARPHLRLLQRVLGLGGASVLRDLERLVTIGVLERDEDGRRVHYQVATTSELWTALRLLIGASSDPTELVRDALCDVGGLQAAFVFGSTARVTREKDSDVDVFIVEDTTVDNRALLRQLAEVGMLLRCEVNVVRYNLLTLAERLANPEHAAAYFVHEVLTGPKRWVAGSETALVPLATVAGVRISEGASGTN